MVFITDADASIVVVVLPLAQYVRLALGETPARSAKKGATQWAGPQQLAHNVVVASPHALMVQQQQATAKVGQTDS